MKTQSEIALAKVKADLDAKLSVLDAYLKAATEATKAPRSYPPGARIGTRHAGRNGAGRGRANPRAGDGDS